MSTEELPLRRRTSVSGVELAWDVWGPTSSPLLVVCHGYTGSRLDFAPRLPELLGMGVRVAMFEHRGHGSSSWGAPSGYTLAQLSRDAANLLPQFGEGPAALLGHSMGGYVAMSLAVAAPHLVASLIVMDSSAWSFRDEDPETAALLEAHLDAFDPTGSLAPALPMGVEDELIAARLSPAAAERRLQAQRTMDPDAFRSLGRELFGSVRDLRSDLAGLDVPATVIVGEHDEPFRSQAPELAKLLRGELRVVWGAYHSPQLTHESQWLEAVRAHLSAAHATG